jgi:NAD(P)-dependent dehydrogenase (short-subunit alcohol dehydrogenase family)
MGEVAGMLLKDRVALITGAGRGIGFGVAQVFGREGAQVVIGELVEERGQQAAEKLVAQGYLAQAHPLDVTRTESCAQIVDQVLGAYGRIDILVNNAGLFLLEKSEEVAEDHWRLQVDVMLNGAFFMTQAVARAAMIPQRSGVVVNIASIGGMGGWPMRSAYNAAKAGLIVLTEVLATEWAQYNIRLNCISPSVTRTDMMESMIKQGSVTLEKYSNRTPIGRVAEVSEIADAVLFLASDRASYITGENLRVDGGWVPYGNLHALGFPEEG